MDESPTERLTWQDALDEGRAGEALARYRRSEQVDGDIYDALDALAAMQVALRDKGYARAVRALGDVERRPRLCGLGRARGRPVTTEKGR